MSAMPAPIWDQRPCHGLRTAYDDRVQPLGMCRQCVRWLCADNSLQPIRPRAEVAGIVPLLRCADRIDA